MHGTGSNIRLGVDGKSVRVKGEVVVEVVVHEGSRYFWGYIYGGVAKRESMC